MRISELASDLQALRANLVTELEAINRYEPQIESMAHEEARTVVQRIVDTRKEHVALLVATIEQLDPKQREAAKLAGDNA
jgi:rubrerythrin